MLPLMANRQQRFISDSNCYDSTSCDDDSYPSPPPSDGPYYSPPPPPPPTTTTNSPGKVLHNSSNNITLIVVLFLCALAVAFLFLSYLTVRKQRNSRARTASRRRTTTTNEEMENPANLDLDLLDDNQGPELDHHIWYIRTVGLQQSVIESITIFKYKRGESLIEGTDCSVCLSEFEEDETLRLLPKCSHAFHIHCIDTWLSSHQNCPLCRAPIVSAVSESDAPHNTVVTINDQAQLVEAMVQPEPQSLMSSQSQRLDHVLPHEVNLRVVDQFSVEEEEEDQDMVSVVADYKDLTQARNNRTRVLSDLGDHRRSVLKGGEEGAEDVGRRSVSMDASSAAYLTASFLAVAKSDGEGCSSDEPPPSAASASLKKKTKSNSLMDGNREGDKSMTSRVTKTYSFGRFLQRGPPVADLKRSTSSASATASSSGGFFSLSRH